MVLTEGFCVFVRYTPLDDICSTYTQTKASSKTYIGIGIGYYSFIYQYTNDTMDPPIDSDRVLTDMIVLTLKRKHSVHACLLEVSLISIRLANCLHLCMSTIACLVYL